MRACASFVTGSVSIFSLLVHLRPSFDPPCCSARRKVFLLHVGVEAAISRPPPSTARRLPRCAKTKTKSCKAESALCGTCRISREETRAAASEIGKAYEVEKREKKGLLFSPVSRILHTENRFLSAVRETGKIAHIDRVRLSHPPILLCFAGIRQSFFVCFLQTRLCSPRRLADILRSCFAAFS